MKSKVISKIRCHSPNQKNTPILNYNYLYYIATREGVDLYPLDQELSQDMTGSSDNETYMRYIHERPRSNGLFGNIDTSDVNAVCRNMKNISKTHCIYRGILSLSEEDAQDLNYMDKAAWKDLLTLSLPEISSTLGIPATELQWVAAFHKEKGHPHVHYMLWSKNPKHVPTPYISIRQQHRCREILARRITANKRNELNILKTQSRDALLESSKKYTQTKSQKLADNICTQPSFQTLRKVNRDFLSSSSRELADLVTNLPKKGSIKYAYLPPEVKKQVDQIVQNMIGKEELKKEYDSFLNYHKEIASTYSPTQKELRIAILKAKEDIDQRLANVVLKAAQELRKDKSLYYALLNTRLPSYKTLLKRGISNQTIFALKNEIKDGDSQAAYLLGRIYDDPDSAFHDHDKAIHFYQNAADNGNTSAKSILGSKYIWGKDVKQNEKLGRTLLHEAQKEGNEYAKDAEQAYDSYQKERAEYRTISLMSDLLVSLCYANTTRNPSSVYRQDDDKNNIKALREKAKLNPHKHSNNLDYEHDAL